MEKTKVLGSGVDKSGVCDTLGDSKEIHKPIQREDGSIYCYCDNLPNKRIKVNVNHLTKELMCSVCGVKVVCDTLPISKDTKKKTITPTMLRKKIQSLFNGDVDILDISDSGTLVVVYIRLDSMDFNSKGDNCLYSFYIDTNINEVVIYFYKDKVMGLLG